ncbi:hypothetical protein KG892_02575 [Vermiphilus pyriformis]|nr:MAG: hypothetical protein KG892_02575 [Vermiphilus pyriformis]
MTISLYLYKSYKYFLALVFLILSINGAEYSTKIISDSKFKYFVAEGPATVGFYVYDTIKELGSVTLHYKRTCTDQSHHIWQAQVVNYNRSSGNWEYVLEEMYSGDRIEFYFEYTQNGKLHSSKNDFHIYRTTVNEVDVSSIYQDPNDHNMYHYNFYILKEATKANFCFSVNGSRVQSLSMHSSHQFWSAQLHGLTSHDRVDYFVEYEVDGAMRTSHKFTYYVPAYSSIPVSDN